MSTTNEPATYVLIRRGNKALFVLREHNAWMKGYYSLPAGRVEANESFLEGAAREAFEEVGVVVRPQDLVFRHALHRMSEDGIVRVDIFFEASQWEGTPKNAEPKLHSKIEWLDVTNLPHNVIPNQAHALQHIAENKPYSELGWD